MSDTTINTEKNKLKMFFLTFKHTSDFYCELLILQQESILVLLIQINACWIVFLCVFAVRNTFSSMYIFTLENSQCCLHAQTTWKHTERLQQQLEILVYHLLTLQ